MRLFVTALFVGLLSAGLIHAQDKKDPPKKVDNRQAQFQEIIDAYIKVLEEVNEAVKSAKTEAEKKAAAAKKPKAEDFMPRVMKFVEGNPSDDLSLNALAFAFYELKTTDAKATKILFDNFAKSKKMINFIGAGLEGAPDNVKPIMEKLMEEGADKATKGLACLALANMAAANDKEAKKAEELFEKVTKDFGDVEIGDAKLAEMAKAGLTELRTLGIGKPAPAVESETLKGEKTSLAAHKGKVVVLDIWATWCGPCRAMIPHEREMVARLKDKPFTLISVSADDDKETLEKFLEKEKMPWVHWFAGPKGVVLKTYNVRFFPTIYVIDANGIIRYKNIRGEELEQAVDKLLAEVKK